MLRWLDPWDAALAVGAVLIVCGLGMIYMPLAPLSAGSFLVGAAVLGELKRRPAQQAKSEGDD